MQELRQSILNALKTYHSDKKMAALLRHELEFPITVTPTEQMEIMAFSKGAGLPGPSAGHVSDKTYHIALNYQQQSDHQNRLEILDLSLRLEQLERKLYRLEYCVSQLEENQCRIIQAMYFNGQSICDLADALHMSESTVKRYRDKALTALTDMYCTLQRSGVILNW